MDKTSLSELNGIIRFWESMAPVCDPSADGHDDRTGLLAASLAIRMKHPKDFIEIIVLAARVHDIGKLAIPKTVLSVNKLSEAERAMIESHAESGAKALEGAGVNAAIVSIVWAHHENYDGTGYPRGLSGQAIPMGARILRVVDTWDALTTDRSYRKGMAPAQALEEMEAKARWYDPEVLRVFKRMMTNA